MKKKLLLILTALVCVISFTLGFSACNGNNSTSGTPVHSHSWSQTWEKDDTHHWHGCTVSGCTEKKDYSEHDFLNDVCFCGAVCIFDYELNGDNESYAISGIHDKSLNKIVIPDNYAGKPVTNIRDGIFRDCSFLTSVTIGNNVTRIGDYAFNGCSSLTSINIPNSVKYLGIGAFLGCDKLIQIENGVQYVDKWVIDCDSAVSAVILRSNTQGIGERAFSDCSKLTSIALPDGVTSIGSYAFGDCIGLTDITIGKSITQIGYYAFYHCTKLAKINFADFSSYCSISGLGNLGVEYKNIYINHQPLHDMTSIVIPQGVTRVGEYTFYGCSSLTSITIPDSVTSICKCAFSLCSGLTNITLPSSVTNIDTWAFSNCGLMSIIVPTNVISIGERAFIGCDLLTSVTFENVNGWKVIEELDMSSVISLSSTDLSDSFTAATYLKSTYCDYPWKSVL